MNDIRDFSGQSIPLIPLYGGGSSNGTTVISEAGMPSGMSRLVRTTDLSIVDTTRVANTSSFPSCSYDTTPYSYIDPSRLKLSDITGESSNLIFGNTHNLNKRLAKFILTHLSKDNPKIAFDTINDLILDFYNNSASMHVVSHDLFSALSFFISDFDNWNGNNSAIKIPDWAVRFFNEHEVEIKACVKDIRSQLEGDKVSKEFSRRTARMSNAQYNRELAGKCTKPQQKLMIKAGEAYLAEAFGINKHNVAENNTGKFKDEVISRLFEYHESVIQAIQGKLCQHLIVAAAQKKSITLAYDDARAILLRKKCYVAFFERAEKLKNDLLKCKLYHHTFIKGSASEHFLPSKPHFSLELHDKFIRATGLLLTNLYCYPIPDKFFNKFFEG